MRTLPDRFTKNGFDFEIIKREGDVALLSKSKPNHSRLSWEVVRIQSHDGYEIAGVEIPPGESMPSSETWGKFGWTFSDMPSALTKFRELTSTPK